MSKPLPLASDKRSYVPAPRPPRLIKSSVIVPPLVRALPPVPTMMRSPVEGAPSSKASRAPPASVRAFAPVPSVRTSAALFVRSMYPAEATVKAEMPPVPKPARRVPSLTVTAGITAVQAVEAGMMTMPGPVLASDPVLAEAIPPVRVREPVDCVTFRVPPLTPSVAT